MKKIKFTCTKCGKDYPLSKLEKKSKYSDDYCVTCYAAILYDLATQDRTNQYHQQPVIVGISRLPTKKMENTILKLD